MLKQMLTLVLAWSVILACTYSVAAIDPDKAAELSREIREYFRATGANWISPKMFKSEVDLTRNDKPIMFVFTSRSCTDCRIFMSSWADLDKTMLSSLTAQFLSVLVLDDYMMELSQYSLPEADYLPRVIFADPDGTIQKDFKNLQADESAPFAYDTAEQVVHTMRRFLKRHWENQGTDVFRGDLQDDIL